MPVVCMENLSAESFVARRDLRREEMAQFGGRIAWLQDPALIPESATKFLDHVPAAKGDPYFGLGTWMVGQFANWSAEVHSALDFGNTFKKHKLPNAERVAVRDVIREAAIPSYGTGIMATSEIYGVVPSVAARQGITDPEAWIEIASRASNFGRALSNDGSNTLAFVRAYLSLGDHVVLKKGPPRIDPAKIKLDDELGITTVTDLDKLVAAAKAISDIHMVDEGHAGTCVAIQASPQGPSHGTMYDMVWNAYGTAAANHIYPYYSPKAADMAGPEEPDVRLEHNLHEVGKALKAEYIESLAQG